MKPEIFLLLAVFFLSSCRSITHNSAEIAVPPKTVIFSFDDGPNAHNGTTARLLDVLKKYDIKAMFALLGENAESHPELVRRIYDEGHLIINHGYYAKWGRKMGGDQFLDNLIKGEKAISEALGKELHPKLYRPHGGFYSSKQERIILEAGYAMVHCSIRAYDAVKSGADQDKIVRRIIKKTEKQNGGIILLHDSRDSRIEAEKAIVKNPGGPFDRSWLPEAAGKIITALLSKGYNLNGLSEFAHYQQ